MTLTAVDQLILDLTSNRMLEFKDPFLFQDLVTNHQLVAGASYLVTAAWTAATNVFGVDKNVLVTAISPTLVSGTCWVEVAYIGVAQTFFLKATLVVNGNFNYMVLTEHSRSVPLTPAQCGDLKYSFDFGTKIYIRQASGQILITEISGLDNNTFNSKEVKKISTDATTTFGSYDYTTDTFTPYTGSHYVGYKSYVALISQSGTNNPVVTVLCNEIDSGLHILRAGVGVYYLQQDTIPVFTTNKTTATISKRAGNNDIDAYWINTQDIQINTIIGSTPSDSVLTQSVLEVRVYN